MRYAREIWAMNQDYMYSDIESWLHECTNVEAHMTLDNAFFHHSLLTIVT